MIKSSLFNTLFESDGSGKRKASKQESGLIGEIDDAKRRKRENEKRVAKGLEPIEAKGPATQPKGHVKEDPFSKENEAAEIARLTQERETKKAELFKLKKTEPRGSEKIQALKAEIEKIKTDIRTLETGGTLQKNYSDTKAAKSLYVLDRNDIDSLLTELSSLDFIVSPRKVNKLLQCVKTALFSNAKFVAQIEKANSSNVEELKKIFNASGFIDLKANPVLAPVVEYGFPLRYMHGSEYAPMAYPAIVGFVFPFIDPDILASALHRSNVTQALNSYAEEYKGSLIKPINWLSPEGLPDFSTFQHINSPALQGWFNLVKENAGSWKTTAYKKFPKAIEAANNAIRNSNYKSVATNKHKNAVIKNIYYSLMTRNVPFFADLFELNDKEVEDKISSGELKYTPLTIPEEEGGELSPEAMDDNEKKAKGFSSLLGRTNILSDRAYDLLAARRQQIEQDPNYNKGLFGRNVRKQLAFDYAKRVTFKLKQEALAVEQSKSDLEHIFDELLVILQVDPLFSQVGNILELFFTPEEKDISPEIAKKNLDAFIDEAVIKVNNLSEKHYLNIYDTLAKRNPAVRAEYAKAAAVGEGDVYKIQRAHTLISPCRDAILDRCAKLKQLRVSDFSTIKTTNDAIVDFMAKPANAEARKALKVATEAQKQYNIARAEELKTNPESESSLQAYKMLLSISKVSDSMVTALRVLRRPIGEDATTPAKKQYKLNTDAIHRGRLKVRKMLAFMQPKSVDTEVLKVLGYLNVKLTELAVNDSDLLYLIINGPSSDEDQQKLYDFFYDLADEFQHIFFNPNYEDGVNFSLFADDTANSDVIEKAIVDDLYEKSKSAAIALNGTFTPLLDYFKDLSPDLINFVNLAAAVKNFTGISVDNTGEFKFDYDLDNIGLNNGFFETCVFTNDRINDTDDPIMLSIFQRAILSRLQAPLETVLGTLTIDDFLLPEVIQEQPALASQLTRYIENLKNAVTTGIPAVIAQLDNEVITERGGSQIDFQSVQEKLNTAAVRDLEAAKVAVTKATTSDDVILAKREVKRLEQEIARLGIGKNVDPNAGLYIIPTERGERLDKVLAAISIKLFKNWEAAAKSSVAAINFVGKLHVAPNEVVANIKAALTIISTALNVDIARRTLYGDDTQIAALKGLIRKYQVYETPESEDAINHIEASYAAIQSFMDKKGNLDTGKVEKLAMDLSSTTGTKGLEILSKRDNKIVNPLVTAVLRNLNDIVSEDSWAAMETQYTKDWDLMRQEGTAESIPVSKIVELLGIAYVDTASVETPRGAALRQLADMFRIALANNPTDKGLKANYAKAVETLKTLRDEKEINAFIHSLSTGAYSEGAPLKEATQVSLDPTTMAALSTPQQESTDSQVFEDSETGLKIKPSKIKQVLTDFAPKIYGVRNKLLNKDQGVVKGTNKVSITPISDDIFNLTDSVKELVEEVGKFLTMTGGKEEATMLVVDSEHLLHNLEVLKQFFDIMKNTSTPTVYNLALQTQLFDTLTQLDTHTLSQLSDEMFVHPATQAAYKNRVKKLAMPLVPETNEPFNVTKSPVAEVLPIASLFQEGMTLNDIKNAVIPVMATYQQEMADPEKEATLNTIPNAFYSSYVSELRKEEALAKEQAAEEKAKAAKAKKYAAGAPEREAAAKAEEDKVRAMRANQLAKAKEAEALKQANPTPATPIKIPVRDFITSLSNPDGLGNNYEAAIATVQDPNTWAAMDSNISSMAKSAAVGFLATIPPSTMRMVMNNVQTGKLRNLISGEPIVKQISISECFSSKLDFVKALLEEIMNGQETVPAVPQPEAASEEAAATPRKEKPKAGAEAINALAVILLSKGVSVKTNTPVHTEEPEATPEQEVIKDKEKQEKDEFTKERNKLPKEQRREFIKYSPLEPEQNAIAGSLLLGGKEYNFESLKDYPWLVYAFYPRVYENMAKISNFMSPSKPITFRFQVGPDAKTSTYYINITDFADIYYKVNDYYKKSAETE